MSEPDSFIVMVLKMDVERMRAVSANENIVERRLIMSHLVSSVLSSMQIWMEDGEPEVAALLKEIDHLYFENLIKE